MNKDLTTKFINTARIKEYYGEDFEPFFNSMKVVEQMIPRDFVLVEGVDYRFNPKLELTFSGVYKIDTYMNMKKMADMQDWFIHA